jgi:4-diphosphocytidyl-2-C-methyl-D-erythritol kinase
VWGRHLKIRELEDLAGQLGSDVPYFIQGGAALMRGRGERLDVVPPCVGRWLVLVVPPHDVTEKTRRLYAALEPPDFSSGELTVRAADRLRRGELPREDELINSFERAARSVFTGLTETWLAAERLTSRRYFLSGAGPAIFAFAADRTDARLQVAKLATVKAESWAVRTVKHARARARR